MIHIPTDQEVEAIKNDENYQDYKRVIRPRFDSYGIQHLPKIVKVGRRYKEQWQRWYTAKNKDGSFKNLNDKVIYLGHLGRKYWAGGKAGEFVSLGLADADVEDPQQQQFAIEHIAEKLQASKDQFCYIMPNYSPRGRLHILFKVQYKGYPVKYSLFRKKLESAIKPYELYPHYWRLMRFPFGYRQTSLIYDDSADALIPQDNWTWRDQLYHFEKLEPIELSQLPFTHTKDETKLGKAEKMEMTMIEEGKYLYEHGLQEPNSRHDSQPKILFYLYRQNANMQEAIFKTQRLMRKKHNGFSKEANKGNWRFIDRDIEEQGKWLYERLESTRQYPDAVHNLYEGYVCKEDLFLIREISQPLMAILKNETLFTIQSRMANVIRWVRPRRHWDWVYVPWWVRAEITGDWHDYIDFFDALEEARIIRLNRHYKVGSYSQSMQFLPYLKKANEEIDIIQNDGRGIHEHPRAVLKAFPDMSYREFMEFTGASDMTYYRAKNVVNLIL